MKKFFYSAKQAYDLKEKGRRLAQENPDGNNPNLPFPPNMETYKGHHEAVLIDGNKKKLFHYTESLDNPEDVSEYEDAIEVATQENEKVIYLEMDGEPNLSYEAQEFLKNNDINAMREEFRRKMHPEAEREAIEGVEL